MSIFHAAFRVAAIVLMVGALGTKAPAGEPPVEATCWSDSGGKTSLTSQTAGGRSTKDNGDCGSGHSCCSDFCGDDCCDGCCYPCWTVKAGVVVLQRGRPHSSVLIENSTTGATILNANDFNFNWNVGADVSLRRRLASGRELEVRYFGIDGNQATVSGVTSAPWDMPTTPALTAVGPDAFDSIYLSKIFNTEINLRQASSRIDGLTWLIGFRWLQVSDQVNTTVDQGANIAQIDFSTLNNLYGAQIGTDMSLWDSGGPFRVDGVVKVGAYANSAHNGFNLVQTAGPTFTAEDNETQFAFVGEVGITAAYQVSDHVAVRGGYQLLWLEGVAVGGDQPVATNIVTQDGITTGGEMFYHGALVSLDLTW